jgi:ubiquitin carboxyl-terminal hydrolase 25/28
MMVKVALSKGEVVLFMPLWHPFNDILLRLFYGKIRQRLAAVSQDNSKPRSSVHEKEDLFSNLPVNVAEDGFDLYDGLSGYFDDIVDFEGKKARMEVSLVDLPPLLQVQLQVIILCITSLDRS